MRKTLLFIMALVLAGPVWGAATKPAESQPADDLRAINRLLMAAGEAEQQSDYDGAIRAYSAILALKPDDEPILLDRGGNYAGKKDFDHALADFSALIAKQPDNADALNARCWDRAWVNRDLDGALADCSAALKLIRNRQTIAEVHDSRGFVYFRKGDFSRAITDYDAALQLSPRMAESLYRRGLAKVRKGDPAGKADITMALTMDPHAGDDMNGLGLKP